MSSEVDRAVASIAASQRTIVTRPQLISCGLGPNAIAHRVRCGTLHTVFRGVYSVGCGELPALAREQAALYACGSGAFLSHRTAVVHWDLLPGGTDIDVSAARMQCHSRPGLRVHRVSTIDPRELGRKDGLPLSSPARALLEVAPEISGRELERAVDEMLVRRLATQHEIKALVARHPGRRGVARIRALIEDARATTVTRSQAEELFLELLRKGRLPTPEVNARLGPYEVDFLFREHRLIVEIDGFAFHRYRAAFERDRRRDAELMAAGFAVVRFTWRQLVDEPEVVLFRLGQMMASTARARAGS